MKKEGRLVPENEKDRIILEAFEYDLKEGDRVSVVYEVNNGGKVTYAKISKLHKCIREISSEMGSDFDVMKQEIKARVGLCTEDDCKSFADCSEEEIDLAIQECIRVGDFLNMNLR